MYSFECVFKTTLLQNTHLLNMKIILISFCSKQTQLNIEWWIAGVDYQITRLPLNDIISH